MKLSYLIICMIFLIIMPGYAECKDISLELEDNEAIKKIDAEQLFNMGNKYFKNNDFKKAAEFYQTAINIDPTRAKYYKNLAAAQQKIGNNKEAVKNIDAYLKLNPISNDTAELRKIKTKLQVENLKNAKDQEHNPNADLEAIIESVFGNAIQIGIINRADVGYYVTLVDAIKLINQAGSIQLTHSGALTGNFDLFSDPKEECLTGTIKDGNKTYISARSKYQLFLKPKNENESMSLEQPGTNISLRLCSQPENEKKGKIWTPQIRINE